ncbi:MAG: rRNA maturation RNase YbeY [Candidatus Buchananbacteria bacterium CG10_big_fil_rev_8_21_14_0_10_42_9]|uniref:Endoribonuclease YbeY n=1 Tax=Candidatus Buchananbacteria bacterium CG10_big_fil_rev_8_21_14_0_10_42_9 TaxID=1974526 RepID=A0A2H0W244_9BACT|nr:MAG: rRNA maturation RNase YbeY [Candidatus Buchananbacteria bacterium CG10_big_fil_rev_8_21_14_0_10_42_9]
MIEIEVNQKVGKVKPKDFWVKLVKIIVRELNLKKSGHVSLAIVGQKEMRKLNFTYRGINAATNVLSFPEAEVKQKIDRLDENYLGEVVLCWSYIKNQATEQKVEFDLMLIWFFIHGVLHLLGYQHDSQKQLMIMESLEHKILAKI